MMKIKLILSIVMLSLVGSAGHSLQAFSVEDDGLRVADIFQDHMVLQRDTRLSIWGWAPVGEKVSVRFKDKPMRLLPAPIVPGRSPCPR